MKKSYIIFVFIFITFISFSQSYDGKGDTKLNVGYDIYGYGNGLRANIDYGLSDLFSVGAGASYYFSNPKYDYYLYGRTSIHLGLLLDLPSELDIYPSIQMGYLSGNDFGFDAFLGLKYFFTDKIGIYGEVGRNGSIGLSFNL